MNDATLRAALAAAGLPGTPGDRRPLSGGCIHRVEAIEFADGRVVVVKSGVASTAAVFAEEAAGLQAIAGTETVLVPEVLHHGVHDTTAMLVMSHVAPAGATEEGWARFGEELAGLHLSPLPLPLPVPLPGSSEQLDGESGKGEGKGMGKGGHRYGFPFDNHLGATHQPNTWSDDWVVFNRTMRLGHQVRLARDAGLLEGDETRRLSRVLDTLDTLLPRTPRPSLLHGDLWSGNALPTRDVAGRSRVAVIDPAPYVGDGWADVAMMQLFGGFPPVCLAAYTAAIGGAPDDLERRLAVYRLYHLLNHLNLFGRGYAGQMMGEVGRLTG